MNGVSDTLTCGLKPFNYLDPKLWITFVCETSSPKNKLWTLIIKLSLGYMAIFFAPPVVPIRITQAKWDSHIWILKIKLY